MSLKTRKELLAPVAPRYHRASKANKQRILDDASTSYHRRSAITLLNKSPATEATEARPLAKRAPTVRYTSEVQAALITRGVGLDLRYVPGSYIQQIQDISGIKSNEKVSLNGPQIALTVSYVLNR